jgi:predicted nucleotidyltransferase
MPSIVQFFHPGGEHCYDKNCSENGCHIKDWNNITYNHKRKFLLNEGSYIENGKKQEGKLLFWGEWEPPSKVIELKQQTYCPPYGKNPQYLHRPFLPSDDQLKIYQEKHFYQNTDPFVFGNSFIYGICQQYKKKRGTNILSKTKLYSLEIGSIIIFGSRVNFRFVIDTVFVVKTAKRYDSLEDVIKMNLKKYPDIVTKFIVDKNNKVYPPHGYTLYTGATFDDPVEGMYSFVPAKVYNGEEKGFPRFFMPDEFYKSQNNTNKIYFSESFKRDNRIIEGKNQGFYENSVGIEEIIAFWKYIKTQVSKDHVLGVNIKMPEVNNNFLWKNENWDTHVNIKNSSCVNRACY